jgi:NADH-ubiquinone oxidoreductase chain 6
LKNILLDILAFGALLSSVLVITSKNPVISVIFLISVFVNAAGYLIILGIGFIGISYIIVYIGAVIVLFLFVIMMINIKLTDIIEVGTEYTKTIPLAIMIGILFIYELYSILPFTFNDVSSVSSILNFITNLNLLFSLDSSSIIEVFTTKNLVEADTIFTDFLQIQSLGQSLYTYSAILLIITSIILLLSMTSPIFLSMRKI